MQPDEAKVTQHRTIVVGLVWNRRRELLLCKMTEGRGVFPGQWGFPGGGIESGEQMTDALHRELSEELGIEIDNPVPTLFKDCLHSKTFATGSVRMVYTRIPQIEVQIRHNEPWIRRMDNGFPRRRRKPIGRI